MIRLKSFLLMLNIIFITSSYCQTADDFIDRGIDKLNAGDYRNSILEFTKALELEENNVNALYLRGKSNELYGDIPSALTDYNNAIQIDNTVSELYFNRGRLRSQYLLDYEGAISDYSYGIELEPSQYSLYLNRGVCKSKIEDHLGAIRDFNKAVELNSQKPSVYLNRGNSKDSLGDFRGAISDYSKAIELDPNMALAYSNRGKTYGALEENNKAIIDFDKAIHLDPRYPQSWLFRGIIKVMEGDKDDGCMDLSTAGELGMEEAYDAINKLCN